MKEIVSLKKILNNETVLQIYVCFMPGIGIDAYCFDDNNDLDDWGKLQQHHISQTEISPLYETRLVYSGKDDRK